MVTKAEQPMKLKCNFVVASSIEPKNYEIYYTGKGINKNDHVIKSLKDFNNERGPHPNYTSKTVW